MVASTDISGFVLAGGRSSRLGRDKALLPWPPNSFAQGSGETLLQHSVSRLQRICSAVSVCANRDDLPFAGVIIPDAIPGSGPLGGIVAALENSATDWNLLLAVDLPFLPVHVLQALVDLALPRETVAAESRPFSRTSLACLLPQLDGLPQPLCGIYHRTLAPGLRAALEAGKFKIMAALDDARNLGAVNSQFVDGRWSVELWDAAAFAATLPSEPDPAQWFLNINTSDDWKRARQLQLG